MQELQIPKVSNVEGYFIRRIATFLKSKGKIPIAWDEALRMKGLSEGDICMSWTSD